MSDQQNVVYVYLITVVDIETGEVIEINRDDITKISSDKRGLVFKSKSTGKQYRQVRTQDEVVEAWEKHGFHSFDSTNVTNMNLAKVYDEDRGRLYFESDPTESSDFASVASVHSKYLKSKMGEFGIRSMKDIKKP